MLTVAKGLVSVPSPLKSIPSTMALGTATPPVMLNPCVAKRYDPRRVCTPQVSALVGVSANAITEVPSASTATIRLTSTHPRSEGPIAGFVNLVLIVLSPFVVNCDVYIPSSHQGSNGMV